MVIQKLAGTLFPFFPEPDTFLFSIKITILAIIDWGNKKKSSLMWQGDLFLLKLLPNHSSCLSSFLFYFALCAKSTFYLQCSTLPLCSTSFNGCLCIDLVAIIAIVCSEWFTCIGRGLRSFWCSGIGVALSVLGCCSHLYLFAGFSLKPARASHVEHRLSVSLSSCREERSQGRTRQWMRYLSAAPGFIWFCVFTTSHADRDMLCLYPFHAPLSNG